MALAIQVEGLSKQYRLGQVGTGTLADDLTRVWYQIRGKEDPFAKIGEQNDRTKPVSNPEGKSDRSKHSYVWALKDLNFQVEQGEVVGVIGANGAGKSTLLKILARVTTPTHGIIRLRGRIASLLEVGTGFHPDLTGRENIYLNGAILGMRQLEISRKLEEIVEFSGCARYVDTPVKRYSSGMYVRLAFAVAAHLEPEILIVDEVLAVGDVEFQNKCIGKMQDVAKGGRTILFVSHNMGAVEKLCTSGLVVKNGAVEQFSKVSDAVTDYLKQSTSQVNARDSLLTDRNRSGTGGAKIRAVTILDSEGNQTASTRAGSSLSLVFQVENVSGEPIESCSLGYSLTNSRGENCVIQYSDYEGVVFRLEPGFTQLTASVKSVPLPNGLYTIGARLVSRGLELDWPKYSLTQVSIEGGGFGGNASHPHSGRGIVLLESDWQKRRGNQN